MDWNDSVAPITRVAICAFADIACIFFFYFVWGDAAAREIVDMLVTEYFLFVWFWSFIIFNYLIILKIVLPEMILTIG